jgi:hypothetical protein
VSFLGTHAFQGDGPGLVYRQASATWDESSSEERKRAMGFQTGTISHTKVTRLECNVLAWKDFHDKASGVLFQIVVLPKSTVRFG